MSLYKVLVSTNTVGRVGSDTLMVSGEFTDINSATDTITDWARNEYAGGIDVDVTFLNHSDQIFVTDLKTLDYDKVIIIR